MSEPRTSSATVADEIVSYVTAHPGCTASEVGRVLGRSSAQYVSPLAVQGRLTRRRDWEPFSLWRYYPSDATPKAEHPTDRLSVPFLAGAAVAFGLVGMGREIQLREEEKAIVHMQCEMARQWSGDDEDPGECPFCGDPWEIVRPGKSQPTCDCQDEPEQRT